MGSFDKDANRLQTLYHRAWLEAGRGFVNPRKYPYLNSALIQYAKEHHCTYEQAWRLAKTGK